MTPETKPVVAQAIIWAAAMLAVSVAQIGDGSIAIVVPILAAGAVVSILIQSSSVKEHSRAARGGEGESPID